ncbi:MAG: UbiA-like polyprenyltransferase [Desulfobacteraceae bacterium]
MKPVSENTIVTYGRMIKFSHTIFALPFALAAVVIAWREHPVVLWDLVWILVAMVGARSAAMGFNRITDAEMDKKNPRTAFREIPSGKLSIRQTALFVAGSALVFILAASMLGPLCFWLSFPVLAFLLLYSYTKRFTALCHLYLGVAISLAPVGAWIAVTGTLSPGVVFLTLALMTYIAGFDILYACQDTAFDREEGLFSLPGAVGPKNAMAISSLLHGATCLFFLCMHFYFGMHPLFLVVIAVMAGLLVAEHRLVRPDNLTRINMAFFHMNSLVSITLLAGVVAEALVR